MMGVLIMEQIKNMEQIKVNRYSIAHIVVITVGIISLIVLAQFVGMGDIIMAGAIISVVTSIVVLLWWVIAWKMAKRENDVDNLTEQFFKKMNNYFLAFVVAGLIIIIPILFWTSTWSELQIFGFGSIFVAGIAIIAILIICTTLLIAFPWPSWMKKSITSTKSSVES